MPSFVRLDDLEELNHQEQCERKFREKHERCLAKFRKEVEILTKSLPVCDSNERQSDRLEEAKNSLHNHRTEKDQLNRDISELSQRLNTLKADNQYMTESNSETEARLTDFQSEKELLDKDIESFRKEVRNKYQAFVMAKNFYKERLNTHFAMDLLPNGDEQITLHLFTSKRTTSSSNTIVLLKSKDNIYSLKSTNPELPMFDSLTKRLKETGDLPGLICCIRKCFLMYYADKAK